MYKKKRRSAINKPHHVDFINLDVLREIVAQMVSEEFKIRNDTEISKEQRRNLLSNQILGVDN